MRQATLHAIEQGGNDTAAIAELVSTAVLRRHLETMERLDIEYDFLPRESEILRLHFWDLAFQQLKDKGVLYFETEGKNKGCWVMTRPTTAKNSAPIPAPATDETTGHPVLKMMPPRRPDLTKMPKSSCAPTVQSATWAKTLRIISGSSGCWDAISAIAGSSAIPMTARRGSQRKPERRIIRTLATSQPFTT